MSMLKPFFEYCVANEWITCNPAALIKAREDMTRGKPG